MARKVGTSGGQGKKKLLVPILYTGGVVVQSVSPAKGGSDEPLEPPPGRAGANSLNFAILIAIPAILTALSHLLLNILAHQGDSQ